MTAAEWITAILVFALAGGCAFVSARQLAQKGFVFNNAYIWASPKERERMDKKPYYRQSAIVFALVSAALFVLGLAIVTQNYKIELLELPLLGGALVYAVVSTIRAEKRARK